MARLLDDYKDPVCEPITAKNWSSVRFCEIKHHWPTEDGHNMLTPLNSVEQVLIYYDGPLVFFRHGEGRIEYWHWIDINPERFAVVELTDDEANNLVTQNCDIRSVFDNKPVYICEYSGRKLDMVVATAIENTHLPERGVKLKEDH